jgi:hypothetical protein
MVIRALLLVIATLTSLVACTSRAPTPSPPAPTPQAKRMQQMLASVSTVRAFVKGDAAQADARAAAAGLVSSSAGLAALFPPDEAARWYTDVTPEMLRAAPITMQQNATRLLAAVESGNRAATADQLARTEHDGCGACHRHGY